MWISLFFFLLKLSLLISIPNSRNKSIINQSAFISLRFNLLSLLSISIIALIHSVSLAAVYFILLKPIEGHQLQNLLKYPNDIRYLQD